MVSEILPDYYAVLQVPPDADLADLKKAYHRLMFEQGAHPDRGGDHLRATQINEAWSVLRDVELRQAYDVLRQPPPVDDAVESRIDVRPSGLDDVQWAQLQRLGELRLYMYQRSGDRSCVCQRCGHPWVTRSFNGMPNRCPACRRTDWAWQRYACCFVCHHGFAVADLDRPINDVRGSCPACKAGDWSLRPVIMRCRACDQPNRVRRCLLEKAYCGRCRYAMGGRHGLDVSVRRWWRFWQQQGSALLDRLIIRPFGSL
ncbi:MAG: DnaJ domain-containing protein [Candidatus Sericytochromatia bacterium]|nr:DnaJ domain-containing protein [Candidatus Sericytochromatia bacterium]